MEYTENGMCKIISAESNGAGTHLLFDDREIFVDLPISVFEPLVGTALSAEEYEALMESISQKGTEYAVKQLSMRMLTKNMLVKKLVEKGFDREISLYVADKIERLKIIDDVKYSEIFIEDRRGKGWGKHRIKAELLKRGVSGDTINEMFDEYSEDDEEIENFIEKKLRGRDDQKSIHSVSGALARRGFSWQDINRAMKKYMQGDVFLDD